MNKDFISIFKKEFSSYFRSNLAYFILAIYALFSLIIAFYGAYFFQLNNSELFSLFYLQPQVLAFITPAITMRLWAEEKRSGTIEFLLTQPIDKRTIVFAKFFSSIAFGLVMLSTTFPLWIYTSFLANLDNLNIICGYFGCFLIICSFCAIGCAVSSVNKNPITAYLISLFICWGASFNASIPALNFQNNYIEFISGQFGLNNLVYFLSIIFLALLINVSLIQQRRFQWLYLSSLTIAFFLINLSSYMLLGEYKLDFTKEKKYSLSDSSLSLLNKLDKNLYIKFYVSKDLEKENPQYSQYSQYVLRFLDKYKNNSNGKISVQLREVEPYSFTEKEALDYQVAPFPDNSGKTNLYLGVIIENDKNEFYTIPFLNPDKQNLLEKDISRKVYKLNQKHSIEVGLIASDVFPLDDFVERINETYEVVKLRPDISEIPLNLDSLILVNPQNASSLLVYAIDQFIMRGGRLLVFLDEDTPKIRSITRPSNVKFEDILSKLDVIYNPDTISESMVLVSVKDYPYNVYMQSFGKFETAEKNAFITYKKDIVGAKIKGEIKSSFSDNLLADTKYAKDMLPFMSFSIKEPKVTLIADANMITQPANLNFLELLVDEINDNNLIINTQTIADTSAIIDNINQSISERYEEAYIQLYNKIKTIQENNLAAMNQKPLSMTIIKEIEANKNILHSLQEEMKFLDYQSKKAEENAVYRIIIINLCLPLLIVITLFVITIYTRRRKAKKAVELLNE